MAGVGSAINDTSREVGGTLGVAIIGSVFSTTYGPQIVKLLTPFNLPKTALTAAEESVGAAFVVSEQLGDATLTDAVREIAGSAFLDGFQAACTTVGVIAILGSLLAYRFLPRSSPQLI